MPPAPAEAMAAESKLGKSRMSCALSAWRERRAASFRDFSSVFSSLDLLYDEANLTAEPSRLGIADRIASVDDERSGSDWRSVDRWSDDVVVVRWERELKAWTDTKLL